MPYSHPWGHDRTWEREVVERIRRGGDAPRAVSFYDSCPATYLPVSLSADGWEEAEERSKGAIRVNSAYLNDEAIAARQAERTLHKQALKEALAQGEAARKADRVRRAAEKVEKAERQRRADEERAKWAAARAAEAKLWEEGREERERLAAERQALWAASAPIHRRLAEERAILKSKWICTECNGTSWIQRDGDGYRLTCIGCGKSAWGSHEAVMKVRMRT